MVICSLLQFPVTSSLLAPDVLLNTLFSNIFSLRFSLNTGKDQVSLPYKTKDKILILSILVFIFLDTKMEDKILCAEWQQALPHFNLLLISSWIEFVFEVVALLGCYAT
jgi:hypothetical protein